MRHWYMPQCLHDSVLIPAPKSNKDPSSSQSYVPIALSSSLSKILERLIFSRYEDFFHSDPLQFGFKPGYSTTLCSGIVKNVISRYIHNGSAVLGCFLDASKAFDSFDHAILFRYSLTVVYHLPLYSSCFHGIVRSVLRCVGVLASLSLSAS